uniref:Uncharacterized protein n=1 Tax=Anguilla anguilla TaxID=7936 RepID=A0A0E9T1U9_ANGAN
MYYRFGNKVPVMSMLHDIRYFRLIYLQLSY